MLMVFKIIASKLVAGISLNSDENTCNRSAMC